MQTGFSQTRRGKELKERYMQIRVDYSAKELPNVKWLDMIIDEVHEEGKKSIGAKQ